MSSSLVLASDHNMTSLNLGEDLQTRNDHHHQTVVAAAAVRRSSSSSGTTTGTSANTRRKSSRANEGCKKKPPQRGMGVAQLERLRLQERWKKITQINPPCASTSSTTPPLLLSAATLDTSLFATETKVQFPKFPGFGNGVVTAAGLLQQQQQQQQQQHGQGLVPADHHHHHHDVLQGYLYGIGNMINNGNSKELSSTPKVSKCFTYDHCADCHKKKRTFTGENLMMFGDINKYANSNPVSGCDFTGLNVSVKGDVEKKATSLQSGISSLGFCNTDSEVEVVAVQQKKGSSGSQGIPNNGVTEYEFFPGKSGYRSNGLSSPSHNDQLLMMKKLMGKSSSSASESGAVLIMGGGGEGSSNCFATTSSSSSITTTTTTITTGTTTTSGSTTAPHTGGASVDASTSIDLSLRLSY